jgi:cytochrome P450
MTPVSALSDFDPSAPDIVADPYTWYEAMLKDGPLHWIPSKQLWMVVGYDEVASVLRNPSVYSSRLGFRAMGSGKLGIERPDSTNMFDVDVQSLRMLISTDPPEHTRIRRLLSGALTPRTVAELEPRLQEICNEMVDELIENTSKQSADLVRDLASPFPVTVIAELLDVPIERRSDFRRWSEAMVGALNGDLAMADVQAAGAELFTFMADIVEKRRLHPGKDLISRLMTGGDADDLDTLSFEEITMIAILLLAAGNETTTNLLGNAAACFAAHPDQAELLWDDPQLVPSAIEEVLRYESPVQGMLRGTTCATNLGGVHLPAGTDVLVSFAAANRDPSHFPEANRFDIKRNPGDHFAFGHGIHFCLGASLARIEARLAIQTLIDRGIKLVPAGGAVRTTGFLLRGFTSYPVTTGDPSL